MSDAPRTVTTDALPTVTLATLQVDYGDGSGVIVAVPAALACELIELPSALAPGEDGWHDAALLDAPGGRVDRVIYGQLPMDLHIRLQRVKGCRMAIRDPGEAWPDGTHEWLANGDPAPRAT